MEKLEKARAYKCFGGLLERVALDPDAGNELVDEYNCEGCDSYEFCIRLRA